MATLKEWKRDFNKLPKWEKFSIVTGLIIGIIGLIYVGNYVQNYYQNSVTNSSLTQSPLCVGQNCNQNITYNINSQDTKSIYVSPSKKLIKANMADYSFPLRIVNERHQDYNDMGLIYIVPADYGIYRIMIDSEDKREKISKYNGSFQLWGSSFGWEQNGKYFGVNFIESLYSLETKEYTVTVNTRDYDKDIFIEFGLINLTNYPELKAIFKGFGVE